MKSSIRILILSTFILPVLIVASWWSLRQFSSPGLILSNPDQITQEANSKLVAVDGASIPITFVEILNSTQTIRKRKILIFISDLNRDRNWQSKGISPTIGKYISQLVEYTGNDSLRFDMRGTGQNNASKNSQTSPSLHLKDLQTVTEYVLKKGYNKENILLLAHGEYGCMLALSNTVNHAVKGPLILLNCAARGSYLETWGTQLFAKMRRRGVSQTIVAVLKLEWQQFLLDGKIKTITIKTLPDVQAFRNTLHYLLKDENRDLYQTARRINLDQKIDLITKQGQTIHHFVSQYDPGISITIQNELVKRANQLNRKYYSLIIIKNSDYYLRQSSNSADHFMGTLGKDLNPLTQLSIQFQKQLINLL